MLDLPLTVGEGRVDVGAAAKLNPEKDLDRVFELLREIDDGGVEADEPGRQAGHRCHHCRED